MTNPPIAVYASLSEQGVHLYFFKGQPEEPIDPTAAMSVIKCASEDNLLVAKLFNDEDVTQDPSEMYTLVTDVAGWELTTED